MASANKHHSRRSRKTLIVKAQTKPKFVDRLTYMAAIVEPLCSIPQAYTVWHGRSAGSISILSWGAFQIMTLVWIWYAVAHHDRMIFIYQSLFFIIDGAVLVGAVCFGGKLL
jgi:uncharacterized protein with PQ loop repeat